MHFIFDPLSNKLAGIIFDESPKSWQEHLPVGMTELILKSNTIDRLNDTNFEGNEQINIEIAKLNTDMLKIFISYNTSNAKIISEGVAEQRNYQGNNDYFTYYPKIEFTVGKRFISFNLYAKTPFGNCCFDYNYGIIILPNNVKNAETNNNW